MALEPAHDAVDRLVRRPHREADEVERLARHRPHGRAVVVVVPRREELGREDREAQVARDRPLVDRPQLRRRRTRTRAPAGAASAGTRGPTRPRSPGRRRGSPAPPTTPLMRNAQTLSRCHAARSSRTTTATLVSKSVTAIARHDDGARRAWRLGRSCGGRRAPARVSPAGGVPRRHADRPLEHPPRCAWSRTRTPPRPPPGGSPAASSARARATRRSSWKACGGSPTCARNVRASSNRESPADRRELGQRRPAAAQRSSRCRRARRTAACSGRVRRAAGPRREVRPQRVDRREHRLVDGQPRRLGRQRRVRGRQRPPQPLVAEDDPARRARRRALLRPRRRSRPGRGRAPGRPTRRARRARRCAPTRARARTARRTPPAAACRRGRTPPRRAGRSRPSRSGGSAGGSGG